MKALATCLQSRLLSDKNHKKKLTNIIPTMTFVINKKGAVKKPNLLD